MIKRVQQGFTLIELMIVVAIIGILAAIAIPQYTKYVARSEANTGLQAIAALKTAAEDYYAQGAPNAITLAILGTKTDGKASPLGTIATDLDNVAGTGTITFIFDGAASPALKSPAAVVHTLTRVNDGSWTCTTTAPDDYVPKGCTNS